ncbi:MAG: hypothetical protein N2322_06420 [Terrimicrobiaceae bacterium]|nr:hypothetical protein [Terrimicrobiaceae bacterium]
MIRAYLAISLLALVLAGCATAEHRAENEAYRKEQQAGGTLPWNRPASWEGPGALGSQVNPYAR